jgi:[acyl-carrier-protein] S-malonyltransferase
MAKAARAVDEALRSIELGALAFPVVANVDATPNTEASRVPELLVRQIDGPVRFSESVTLVAEAGVTRALEIGPGKVLAGLVKRIDKRISVLGCFDPSKLGEVSTFLG